MKREWPKVRLGEVLRQVDRSEAIDASRGYRLMGVRWYGQGLFVREERIGADIAANRVYSVKLGDFVYNRLFAWKGSFAVAGPEAHEAYVSNEFPCFLADRTRLDPYFLLWLFREERAWSKVLGLSTGATPTSRNRLKESVFLAMEIPLPPLAEQRRVVVRIEELATQIHEARSLRQQAAEQAKVLILSKISSLFDGLVGSARVPIRTLGVGGKNPVQTGPFGAQLHSSEFVEEGVPVLNVGNVWPEGLRLDRLDRVRSEKAEQLSRYSLEAEDLLFARSGATLGKVCLVPKQCNGWLMTGHLFRVRFDQSRVFCRFAFAALRGARSIHAQVFGQVRGATRPGYNTKLLGNVEIPLPPVSEQRRIVTELDALQAEVDTLRHLQAETTATLDALLPAVLDRAFKGEL
jgi:type I restriction enzyme S subunit